MRARFLSLPSRARRDDREARSSDCACLDSHHMVDCRACRYQAVLAVTRYNFLLDGRRPGGLPHFGQRRAVKPSVGSPPGRRVEPVQNIGNCYSSGPSHGGPLQRDSEWFVVDFYLKHSDAGAVHCRSSIDDLGDEARTLGIIDSRDNRERRLGHDSCPQSRTSHRNRQPERQCSQQKELPDCQVSYWTAHPFKERLHHALRTR